jgi:phage shock protein PspC (stress-responsive transcriptional regulator)
MPETTMTLARVLLVLGTVGHLLIYLVAAPEHVVDASWPDHARFHVLEAIFWAAGLDVVALAITWWPLPRREPWAWWALAAVFLFGHVSYVISIIALPEGRPPNVSADITLAIAGALFGVGLVLARPRRVA